MRSAHWFVFQRDFMYRKWNVGKFEFELFIVSVIRWGTNTHIGELITRILTRRRRTTRSSTRPPPYSRVSCLSTAKSLAVRVRVVCAFWIFTGDRPKTAETRSRFKHSFMVMDVLRVSVVNQKARSSTTTRLQVRPSFYFIHS